MNSSASSAYTLIEILIVLVIIGLFTSIGYANFRGYARRQQSINIARQVEADLRYAQELSLSGQKPAGFCNNKGDQLDAIVFNVNGESSYQIYAHCILESGGEDTSSSFKNISLPESIKFQPVSLNIMFYTIGRGTNLSDDITLSICTDQEDSGLLISKQGKIQSATPSCP